MQVHYDDEDGEHWVDPDEAERADADFETLVKETAIKASREAIKAAVQCGFDPAYLHERVIDEMTGVDAFAEAMKAEGVKPSLTFESLAEVSRIECRRIMGGA